jgi:hypothetical protein
MKEGLQKQMADKAVGRHYDTGTNMGSECDEVADGGERRPKKAVSCCIFCGGWDYTQDQKKQGLQILWLGQKKKLFHRRQSSEIVDKPRRLHY